jgi:hypothetical protein
MYNEVGKPIVTEHAVRWWRTEEQLPALQSMGSNQTCASGYCMMHDWAALLFLPRLTSCRRLVLPRCAQPFTEAWMMLAKRGTQPSMLA